MPITITNQSKTVIVGVAENGDAKIRMVIPAGESATVEGNKVLPGVVPVWVWNQIRETPITCLLYTSPSPRDRG